MLIDEPPPGDVHPSLRFVDEPQQIEAALRAVDGDIVGVDVERADGDRYFRRAALVQIGLDGCCVLLDGVALTTLPQLDAFLGADGRLAVLHAVENDLEPLAAKGVVPGAIADTAVAAAILGLPTGLATLLAVVLGVELATDKTAYQRADWEMRPLSEGMAAYAAGDVVHLPALWAALADRLEGTGRRAWYDEELRWTLAQAQVPTRAWTRVKGAGRLAPEQRAVLRAVWEERERLSREHDIAPNRLLHDDALREIAGDPPASVTQLVRRARRNRSLARRHGTAFLDAIERGRGAPPETKESSRRWGSEDRDVFDALRRRRSEVAEQLGVDAGVLCPSRSLWPALAGDPADGIELCRLAGLRDWQTEVLADPLWETYTSARTTG